MTATICLDGAQFGADALAGIGAFSHLEVVYLLDRVDPAGIERGARHPRGNPDWPRVGIFAQRAKDRPNRLGVSRCRLLALDGLNLHVEGLDAVARHAGPGHQALHERVRPPGCRPPARLVGGADGRLLVAPFVLLLGLGF